MTRVCTQGSPRAVGSHACGMGRTIRGNLILTVQDTATPPLRSYKVSQTYIRQSGTRAWPNLQTPGEPVLSR
jgi:hypothetical protein